MKQKFQKGISKILLTLLLASIFTSLITPQTASAATLSGQFSNDYKKVTLGGVDYDWLWDNGYILFKDGKQTSPPGDGPSTVFKNPKWNDTKFGITWPNCLSKEESTKKYIRIDTSTYNQLKKDGKEYEGELFTYYQKTYLGFCQLVVNARSGTPTESEPVTLKQPTTSVEKAFYWSGSTVSPSAASIVEAKPNPGVTFLYYMNGIGTQIFINSSKDQIIEVPNWPSALWSTAPNVGTWKNFSNGTAGGVISEISISNNGLPFLGEVVGSVYFKDGKSNFVNFESDYSIPVKVYKDGAKMAAITVNIDKGSGQYNLGSIGNGEYRAVVSYKTDDALMQWIKKLGGGEYKIITGETTFTVTDKGVTKGTPDITLNVEIKEIAPITEAWFNNGLKQALISIATAISGSLTWGSDTLNSMMREANNIDDSTLENVWTNARNVSLGLLTLALLIIALANILQIDLEKYGVTRMIPHIVISIVMVYFSFFIARLLLDVASALQAFLVTNNLDATALDNLNLAAQVKPADLGNLTGTTLILIIAAIIAIVAFLWLIFVLVIRKVVIYFLIAIAPIAFIMNILPFTQSLYSQWWQKYWKWVFMGPAIAFFLYLTNEFVTKGFGYSIATGGNDAAMYLLMAAVGLIMAASVPMTLGGDIINQVTGAIKKHGTKIPGVKGAKQFLGDRKSAVENRRKEGIRNLRRNIAINGGAAGRWATGVKTFGPKAQAEVGRLREENISEIQKSLAPMKGNYVAMENALLDTKKGSDREAALLREIAEGGYVNTANQAVLGKYRDAFEAQTPGVAAAAFKLKDNLHTAMAVQGMTAMVGGRDMIRDIANGSVSNPDYTKLNKNQLAFIASDAQHSANLINHLTSQATREQWDRTATPESKALTRQALVDISNNGNLTPADRTRARRTAGGIS